MKRIALGISTTIGVLALAGSAPGGAPGKWTRVTVPGPNVDEIGLIRIKEPGPVNVLHVVWPKVIQPTNVTEIWDTRISEAGRILGSKLVSGKWNAAGGPKVIRSNPSGAGARLFFAGLRGSNAEGGIQSAVFNLGANAWKMEAGHVSTDVNAAGTVGAAFAADSTTPVFTWASGSRLFVKTGIDPAAGEQEIGPGPSCCYSWPELATNFVSDVTTLAYGSIVRGKGGLYVRQVKPTLGPPKLVPKSLTGMNYVLPDQRLALIAFGGISKVALAYCSGYPACTKVLLWRVTGGAPVVVATSRRALNVSASVAAYEGRLWVLWWDADLKRIRAARSNQAGTKFGPVVSASLPPGAGHVLKLYGDGNGLGGPLDVLASVGHPSAYWHTRLLPRLQVSCSRVDHDTVKCVVTDVGDPVLLAHVKYEGQVKITPGSGTVTFTSTKPLSKATVTHIFYPPATG